MERPRAPSPDRQENINLEPGDFTLYPTEEISGSVWRHFWIIETKFYGHLVRGQGHC